MGKQRTKAAPGPDRLRERIVERYSALSPQHRTIAEFALANPDEMAVETAKELAARMSVPTSSIVRFAQSLGYDGFNALRDELRRALVYKLGDARERAAIRDQAATGAVAVLDAMLHEGARDIERLSRAIDRSRFDHAARELRRAGTIALSGQQACYSIAVLMHWTLLSLGRRCRIADSAGGYGAREVELLGPDDALVAISFAPYQLAVVETAQAAQTRGCTVVALTDSPVSPLAAHADIVVEIPQRTPMTAHPLAVGLLAAQSLAIAVGEATALR